jgi:RAD50-interacting protein 1
MATYLEPPSAERDTRVADYLDDKLQTLADLSSLDSLLLNVRDQQSLLQQQLDDAQTRLRDARTDANKQAQALRTRAARFERDQADIDRRMMVVTGSETSDEAVKRFEASMDKLKRLDVAKGYLELLQLTETTR